MENGYENGFATFWSAASVMYESNGGTYDISVSCYAVNDENMSACTGVDEQIDMGKTGGEFFLLRMTHPKKAGMTEEGILEYIWFMDR